MRNDNPSKGLWDEPIPANIANAISTTNDEPLPNNGEKPEFNPAFDTTVIGTHRKEVISSKLSPPLPPTDNVTSSATQPVDASPLLHNPDNASNDAKVSPLPPFDTHSKNTVKPIGNLGKKSLFGNMDKFSKPTIIRASIKSVFPHLFLCAICIALALFPSLAINFLGDDFATMPSAIVNNMPIIVGVFFIALAVFILIIMGKQLATGSLWLYEGHLKFKKGLSSSEMFYYGNLQTVEAERTLSSMWSDTGDLVLLHPKGALTMRNVLHPFEVRDAIREQIIASKAVR